DRNLRRGSHGHTLLGYLETALRVPSVPSSRVAGTAGLSTLRPGVPIGRLRRWLALRQGECQFATPGVGGPGIWHAGGERHAATWRTVGDRPPGGPGGRSAATA